MIDIKDQIREQSQNISFGVYKISIDGKEIENNPLYLFCTPTMMTIRPLNDSGDIYEERLINLIKRGNSDWDYDTITREQIIELTFKDPNPDKLTVIPETLTHTLNSETIQIKSVIDKLNEQFTVIDNTLIKLEDEIQGVIERIELFKENSDLQKINIQASILEDYKNKNIVDLDLESSSINPYKINSSDNETILRYTKEISNKLNTLYAKIDKEASGLQNELNSLNKTKADTLTQKKELITLKEQLIRSIERKSIILNSNNRIYTKTELIDTIAINLDDYIPNWSKDLDDLLQGGVSEEKLNAIKGLPATKLLNLVTFSDREIKFSDVTFSESNAELFTLLFATGNIGTVNINGDLYDAPLDKLKDTLTQIPSGKYYIKLDKKVLSVPGIEGDLQVRLGEDNKLHYTIIPSAKTLTMETLKGISFDRGNTLLSNLLDFDSNEFSYLIQHTTGTPNINIFINDVSDDDVMKPFKVKLKEYAGNTFNIILNNKLLTVPKTNSPMQVIYKNSELIFINSKNKEEYTKGGAFLRTLLNQTTLGNIDLSLYGVKGKYKIYIDHTLKVIIITTDVVNNYVALYSTYTGNNSTEFSFKPINSNVDIKLTKIEVETNLKDLASTLYERFRDQALMFLVNKAWSKGAIRGTAIGRLLTMKHVFVPVVFNVPNIITPLKFTYYKRKFEESDIGELFLQLCIPVNVSDITMNFITLKEACMLMGAHKFFKVNSLLITDYLFFIATLNQKFAVKYMSELNYSVPGAEYIISEPEEGYYPVHGFTEYVYDNPGYKQKMQDIVKYLGLAGGVR